MLKEQLKVVILLVGLNQQPLKDLLLLFLATCVLGSLTDDFRAHGGF